MRTLDDTDDAAAVSSPNSAVSSFQMDFCRNNRKFSEGDSEEDENGTARKKLRLSKTQSAFLEDSFKEHTTLNPVSNSHFPSPYLFHCFNQGTVSSYLLCKKSAETKTCSCKRVKSPSPSSGGLVSEQKGKVIENF